MSRVCQVTGKRPVVGNTVSHANNRKRRRFLPNLHTQRFWLETEKRFVTLKVSTRGLRTIEKRGVDVVVAELRAQGVQDLRRRSCAKRSSWCHRPEPATSTRR